MDTPLSSCSLQKCIPTPPLVPFPRFNISSCVKRFSDQTRIKNSGNRIDAEQIITLREKKRRPSFVSTIFNCLDELICKLMDPVPLRPSIDPKHVLSGNFSPVDELPPIACAVVEGSLPPCLNGGAYIRNGPNPQFFPKGPYHLFDGDGMLHALTISQNGNPKFCSRFVKTYKYEIEREAGSPVIINLFSAFNGSPAASVARFVVTLCRVMAGEHDPRRGIGGANTSLALLSGKVLLALGESDLPYAVEVTPGGDIITLGRHECFGEPFMAMTAHPKVDTETGEAFAFRHSVTRPFLSYFRIDSRGIKQPEVGIYSLKESSLVHDFAISENYAVFTDNKIVIRPKEVLRGKSPLVVDQGKIPRLGIIPRYAEDEKEMWWVEVPGFNMLHVVNAWEEEDEGSETNIVLVATTESSVEHMLERIDLIRPTMESVEINVKSKTVTRWPISDRPLEFGVINQAYVGRKNRYLYAGIGASLPKTKGVVKLDLSLSGPESENCAVATRLYGPGCYGGEPFFVSREPDNVEAEEDDGYLLTHLHNENTEESQFIVMDAKSPNLEVVAVVKLPQRVPYGFHGIFVRECC